MIGALRDGTWLSSERVTRIAATSALACLAILGTLLLTAHGLVDRYGRPLGTDFGAFWNAGWLADHGRASDAWDLRLHTATMRANLGDPRIAPTPWFYPPVFLLIMAPLGSLPYIPAMLLWQAASLAMIAAALWPILGNRRSVMVAIASPLTWSVLGHGQNAYLTAASLGAGLALADTRPLGAGALFSALVYKPQLGLLLGPYLLVRRRWAVLVSALASALALIALSRLLWGIAPWHAFFASLDFARSQILELGAVPFYKSGSLFGAARLWGAPISAAYSVQAVGAVAGLALIGHLRAAPARLRSAGVCAAIGLATPYVQDYDLALVSVGAVFLYAEGAAGEFRPWERSMLALIWVQPMFARPVAEWLLLPTGPVMSALLAGLVIRRLGGPLPSETVTALPCPHSHGLSGQ